jgi:hypothetical protein
MVVKVVSGNQHLVPSWCAPLSDIRTYPRLLWLTSAPVCLHKRHAAQLHYPFENKELFESSFPADFVAEGVDQTRGWWVHPWELGTP